MPPLFSGFLALLLFLATLPASAVAQDTLRVAAVVNDDVISVLDLDQRTRLALLAGNLPDNVETRSRVVPSVLRRLIDEHLETQEADRLKITIPASDINNGIAIIERQNNMARGSFEPFLKGKGIDPETIRQQVKAELAWTRVVRHELVPNLHIGDKEVDARLATMRANRGKPEYLAGEIFLAVDDPSRDEEVRVLAERLIDQMHQGAPFSALARQFSQTGSSGGDLGWVSEGMLDDDLMAALGQLNKGTITPPIRTVDGYHVLLLRDKRIVGDLAKANDPIVDVLTIVLNSVPSATANERADQLKRLRESLAEGKTCDDFVRLAGAIPSAHAFHTGRMNESEIPPDIESLVGKLAPGTVSEPLEGLDSRRLFAICSRTEPTKDSETRDDLRQRMEQDQLEIMARGYLRNLRRAAFVEIRV
jgi:peptidyl-prolyl cis-trans isomerase SurA